MERVFTGRELVNTSSRLERNAALVKAVWWGMLLASLLMHLLCLLFNWCMIFMATLRSRCGHYIFALWFLFLSSIFLFFLA